MSSQEPVLAGRGSLFGIEGDGDRRDFHQCALRRKGRHLDCCASREWFREEACVSRIHPGEIIYVQQIYGRRHYVVERQSGCGKYGSHILQGLVGLVPNRRSSELAGLRILPDLARDVDRPSEAYAPATAT